MSYYSQNIKYTEHYKREATKYTERQTYQNDTQAFIGNLKSQNGMGRSILSI